MLNRGRVRVARWGFEEASTASQPKPGSDARLETRNQQESTSNVGIRCVPDWSHAGVLLLMKGCEHARPEALEVKLRR